MVKFLFGHFLSGQVLSAINFDDPKMKMIATTYDRALKKI
mgnify:FL=1